MRKMMFIHKNVLDRLFSDNYQLIDGADDIFELDLALWEFDALNEEELIKRSAYFKIVNGKETEHYKMCNLQNLENIHKNSSFRTKVFFLDGKYSTGYATNSLFPYRGKFHPQFIKSILNILKIKQGEIVLDPMGGSGTLAVECNLLGIDAISVDISPFCKLMSKVKTFSLNLDIDVLLSISKNPIELFKKFNKSNIPSYFYEDEKDFKKDYYEIVLLAYLDSMGFATRSEGSIEKLFPRVLERYISTIKNFNEAKNKLNLKIGKTKTIECSALKLPLEDSSIDAIITSPPYSFAIDYLKNDEPQLKYLTYNNELLKNELIGLQGRGIDNKLEIYFKKIDLALHEMVRVSKKTAPIVIIVGTNEIQTKGVSLELKIKELANKHNLKFEMEISKPIRGIQNSMKNETILFFTNFK